MCTSPIPIYVRGKHFGSSAGTYTVPCGHCHECQKRKQNNWMIRIMEQHKDTPQAFFLTLTYSDDHVPLSVDLETGQVYYTVCKRHVQLWVKRLKTRLQRAGRDFKESPFKYFITSEYGPCPGHPELFRPHYHAIFFGLSYIDLLPSLLNWESRFGYFQCSKVRSRYGAARYVAKYASKGSFENPLIALGKVHPTFHLISHGIGKGYIDRMRKFHLGLDGKFNGSRRVNLYYSKKYLEYVADNLVYRDSRIFNKYGNKAFSLQLPRYYKERILGHTISVAGSRSKKTKVVVCKSALQKQVSDFLFKRRIELRDSKLLELVLEGTCKSLGEADFYLSQIEKEELALRDCDARDSLYKFYYKKR